MTTFEPCSDSFNPSKRSCAFCTSRLPTKTMIFPPCGRGLLDEFASLPASRTVVGTKVESTISIRRITVLSHDQSSLRSIVDYFLLGGRVDGADGNRIRFVTVECLSNEAVLLFYRSGICGFEGHCHVRQFCVSLLAPFTRNLPEIGGAVGNERDRLYSFRRFRRRGATD